MGLAVGHTIWLNDNAAGCGWFADKAPWDDSEFTTPGDQGEQGRMDLVSVVAYELGHIAGLDHDGDAKDVMGDTPSLGPSAVRKRRRRINHG